MTPAEIESYVDAAAAALALSLQPAHRPGVLQFFGLAAGFADVVQAVPLVPHDDPAVTFVPISPAGPVVTGQA